MSKMKRQLKALSAAIVGILVLHLKEFGIEMPPGVEDGLAAILAWGLIYIVPNKE